MRRGRSTSCAVDLCKKSLDIFAWSGLHIAYFEGSVVSGSRLQASSAKTRTEAVGLKPKMLGKLGLR